jgi:hypothetical protein
MTTRAIAPVHAVATHVRPETDRTALLVWRLFAIAVAIAFTVAMRSVEGGGIIMLASEHAPECADFIGEWAARF